MSDAWIKKFEAGTWTTVTMSYFFHYPTTIGFLSISNTPYMPCTVKLTSLHDSLLFRSQISHRAFIKTKVLQVKVIQTMVKKEASLSLIVLKLPRMLLKQCKIWVKLNHSLLKLQRITVKRLTMRRKKN